MVQQEHHMEHVNGLKASGGRKCAFLILPGLITTSMWISRGRTAIKNSIVRVASVDRVR